MTSAVLFAVLAGASTATWTICLKLVSSKTSAVLGAMTITGVAFLVNSIALLVMRSNGHAITFKKEAIWPLALAGLAAAGIDMFVLLAYDRGLRLTASFIVGGTSAALVLLVGFLALHESLTWVRLLAIALIAIGILLLQSQGA